MPSVLFAGGRLDSVSIIAGVPTESTTSLAYDATYCDAALSLTGSDIVQATLIDATDAPTDLTTGQTGYFHFEIYTTVPGNVGANSNIAYLVDAAGNPWLAIRCTGGGVLGLFYNSGTGASPVWTRIGASSYAMAARVAMDIKITLGSPHVVDWSVAGTSLQTGTFTQASLTSLRGIRLAAAGNGIWITQILCAEGRPTVNGKVKYSRATGAGGNSGWTGAFTNVNEPINSDGTLDAATTAALRQTYAMGDVTLPANYSIVSVFHFLRAKNDGAAPANIKSAVRQATTNYDRSTNFPGVGTSFAATGARYDQDPGSAAAWTQTTFNSAEFGYLSAT